LGFSFTLGRLTIERWYRHSFLKFDPQKILEMGGFGIDKTSFSFVVIQNHQG